VPTPGFVREASAEQPQTHTIVMQSNPNANLTRGGLRWFAKCVGWSGSNMGHLPQV